MGPTIIAVIFPSAPFQTPLSTWIYSFAHISFSQPSFSPWEKRHDEAVAGSQDLKTEAITWLANRIPLSLESYREMMLLVSELPNLGLGEIPSPNFVAAPWWTIFDLLGRKHIKAARHGRMNSEEMADFDVLMKCYNLTVIHSIVAPRSSNLSKDNLRDPQDEDGKLDPRHIPSFNRPRDTSNSLFFLLWNVPVPSSGNVCELEVAAELARIWRRKSIQMTQNTWMDAFSPSRNYSYRFLAQCVLCFCNSISVWCPNRDEEISLYIGICHNIVGKLCKMDDALVTRTELSHSAHDCEDSWESLSGMHNALKASQSSFIILLRDLTMHLITRQDQRGVPMLWADVAAIATCIDKVLDLPRNHVAGSAISELLCYLKQANKAMPLRTEQDNRDKVGVSKVLDRLQTILERI